MTANRELELWKKLSKIVEHTTKENATFSGLCGYVKYRLLAGKWQEGTIWHRDHDICRMIAKIKDKVGNRVYMDKEGVFGPGSVRHKFCLEKIKWIEIHERRKARKALDKKRKRK